MTGPTPKKTVLLPLEVPDSAYCWEFSTHNVCQYYDNEGGHSSCDMGFSISMKDKINGVPKPKECMELKNV